MGMNSKEFDNLSEEQKFEAMGWTAPKKERKIEIKAEVVVEPEEDTEEVPAERRVADKNEVPSYVREAEDKAIEAKAQRIFGPPSKRDRSEGWEKREIAALEAYNALLDRREQEAIRTEIEEAREEWAAFREANKRSRLIPKKTA